MSSREPADIAPQALKSIMGLPCWTHQVSPRPLSGGITNHNFLVTDGSRKYVVRLGEDMPVHSIFRKTELTVSCAAHAAGVSPEVIFHQPGVIVFAYIEGTTLKPDHVRENKRLARIIPLIQHYHHEIPRYLRGPAVMFWVFHAIRDYAHSLHEDKSRIVPRLPELLAANEALESIVSPVEIRFCHNDLLAANFIDDDQKIWLIDWEYSGYNSPLFDLANLISNSELSPQQADWVLEAYYEKTPTDLRRRQLQAMMCASLLREAMWSLIMESRSTIAFDYVAYSDDYLGRFQQAYESLNAR